MASHDPVQRRRQRLKLLAVLAVCAAPVIASYVTYYVIKPDGRTNYGELVEPQRPAAGLSVTRPDG
ncbi:MAG: cytochrome C oxidase subunit I, partial [Burkholderiales bacterium]|nr:cytochrome C oxidase subunit I [Burkholderiales bacterium]